MDALQRMVRMRGLANLKDDIILQYVNIWDVK